MNMRKMLLICAAGISAFSTSAFAQGLTKDGLVAQARKEGQVVWYSTPGTQNITRAALDEWKRLYPDIAINVVEANGPDHMERIRTERRASRPVADLLSSGDISMFQFAQENAFQKLDTALLSNFDGLSPTLKPVLDPQRLQLPTWLQAYGIIINTSLVAKEDEPRTFADLLAPKFVRKLAVMDFRRPNGGSVLFMIGEPVLGEKFFADLARQQPRLFPGGQALVEAVARGERAISVPGSNTSYAEHPNSSLKMIYPEDGTYFISFNTGLLANAPHPAAAMLFLDFLLSRETQAQLAQKGQIPVRDDVPTDQISLSRAKLLGAGFLKPADTTKIQGYLDRAAEILRQ